MIDWRTGRWKRGVAAPRNSVVAGLNNMFQDQQFFSILKYYNQYVKTLMLVKTEVTQRLSFQFYVSYS